MPTPKELLLDPSRCGEDLFAIANRAFELAPQLCGQCMSYHMRVAAARCTGRVASLARDRGVIIETLRQLLQTPQIRDRNNPEIAVFGSADTGLLATCAHAVATLGDDVLARTTFTVVDLCPTPLALCAEFAAQHGLKVKTAAFEIVAGELSQPVDIIFMHSVLRFIPAARRAELLRRCGQKLRPGGKLLISNMVSGSRAGSENRLDDIKEKTLQTILALVAAGELKPGISTEKLKPLLAESLLVSQNRDAAIVDLTSAMALFEQADLHADRAEINIFRGHGELREDVRHRLLAVLSP